MTQDTTPSPDVTPEKSEEYKRFENLARRMFNTPKMETDAPQKASNDLKGVQIKVQTENG